MCMEALTWAWKTPLVKTPNERLVLVALADSANADDFTTWPSVSTICARTLLSRRGVQRTIAALVERHVIARVERHRDNGGQTSNVYRVHVGRGGEGAQQTLLEPNPASVTEVTDGEAPDRRSPEVHEQFDHLYGAAVAIGLPPPHLATARTAYMDVLWQLVEAGVTPGEMRRGAMVYHREWPDITLTLAALAKWMPQFLANAKETRIERRQEARRIEQRREEEAALPRAENLARIGELAAGIGRSA